MTNATHTITIDTGFHRPNFDACYLLVDAGRAAFIDCGVNASQPKLMAALARAGLEVDAVDHLILTHVHLDHAGGAGELLGQLPNAKVHVHPRGARHLIDPSALVAGASAVYGADEVAKTYGVLRPIAPERIEIAEEGHRIRTGTRTLICLDAPGHARHHVVIHEPDAAQCFTGDAFGLSYRELDSGAGPFILPTSTPVQFEPEAMKATIARLLALKLQTVCLTHFGPLGEVERLGADLLRLVDRMVALARVAPSGDGRHASLCEALSNLYLECTAAHGSALSAAQVLTCLQMDIELNAQGLGVWLDRRAG